MFAFCVRLNMLENCRTAFEGIFKTSFCFLLTIHKAILYFYCFVSTLCALSTYGCAGRAAFSGGGSSSGVTDAGPGSGVGVFFAMRCFCALAEIAPSARLVDCTISVQPVFLRLHQ